MSATLHANVAIAEGAPMNPTPAHQEAKERPILFSGPMVRALLNGTKTKTRRVVKAPAWFEGHLIHAKDACGVYDVISAPDGGEQMFCPYGQPGQRLWVRETWHGSKNEQRAKNPQHPMEAISYRADCDGPVRWIPSIFMPRWASRITLEVVSVRVERLQDISQEDALAEGIENETIDMSISCRNYSRKDGWFNDWGIASTPDFEYVPIDRIAQESYRTLWESINGKGSWADNPFVWVVEFKRLEGR